MATFPALKPNTRSYIPGSRVNTSLMTLNGDETAVRHSNAGIGYFLRLGFTGITTDEHNELVEHYSLHGRFIPFDIPSSLLQGSNIALPSGYVWIYASSPKTSYLPDLITVTVELELIPTYTI